MGKRWGLSEDEVLAVFEKYSWCMIVSIDKIMTIMDFFFFSEQNGLQAISYYQMSSCYYYKPAEEDYSQMCSSSVFVIERLDQEKY